MGIISDIYKLPFGLSGYGFFVTNLIMASIRISLWETKRKIWLISKLKKENNNYEILFANFIQILGILAIYTCIEAQKVKFEKKFINTSIVIEEKLFVSDSLNFYIGNTNKYIFIYNVKSDVSRVVPMSRVKEMSFGTQYYLGKLKK